jgi:APA family basic amino acid/polyamine antiporter
MSFMDKNEGRGIGFLTCLSLVTATMVGTGVFTSLGFQLQELRSGFSILCLWILGGLISLCGALSYAELASRIPRSGGEYTYLSEIYHPALGFMAAAVSLIAGFAAPISLSAIAFGTYLHAALPSCPTGLSTIAVVVLISFGHLGSLEKSSLLQNGVTALKFLLVGLFIIFGIASVCYHPDSIRVLLPKQGSFAELTRPTSGIALLFVLYAYSGWNAATYLAGEVRHPRRTIGYSLVVGTLSVTFLYVILNAVFLTAAPARDLSGVLNVGSVAATHLMGAIGGRIMSTIIALGLLASISAMIWAGPRVTQCVGEDYSIFAPLAKRRNKIPQRAILLQLMLVLGMVVFGSFETVLIFAQIPLLFCLMLGVVGLIICRHRSNNTPLEDIPFTCPFYPIPPLIFLICSGGGLLYSVITKPWIALAGGILMLIPLFLHRWISPTRHL